MTARDKAVFRDFFRAFGDHAMEVRSAEEKADAGISETFLYTPLPSRRDVSMDWAERGQVVGGVVLEHHKQRFAAYGWEAQDAARDLVDAIRSCAASDGDDVLAARRPGWSDQELVPSVTLSDPATGIPVTMFPRDGGYSFSVLFGTRLAEQPSDVPSHFNPSQPCRV